MKNTDLALLLANKYVLIAKQYNATTAKQLSALTYKLREAGNDIPYLAVATTNINYTPSPTAKQKTWKWLKEQEFGEGFIGFWVHVLPAGYRIEVYVLASKQDDQPRERNIIFDQTFNF